MNSQFWDLMWRFGLTKKREKGFLDLDECGLRWVLGGIVYDLQVVFAVELAMKGIMMVSGFSMIAEEDWWWRLKENKM
ncbi:uncharacterized protein HKW66_Vig0230770 [Vigna angularis]|uniref:Uncharacterized protein n=1 Tax=Phaseolus angularis TaxID=3914 RepID=A0A8T0KD57_PHAAN|nr:uncharacterized protein HKW66_Vig0230770 [Vigna angularis]